MIRRKKRDLGGADDGDAGKWLRGGGEDEKGGGSIYRAVAVEGYFGDLKKCEGSRPGWMTVG